MTIKKDYDIPLRKISLPKFNEVAKYPKKLLSIKLTPIMDHWYQNLEMMLANHFGTRS